MHIYNMVYNGIVFGLISTILAAIVSFGAGSVKLGNFMPQGQTEPIVTSTNTSCYNPQPNVKITLKWPDNFTNVSDLRAVLNPGTFGGTSSTFNNTDPACQNLVLSDKTTRTFILVRSDVRISSCKTDEGGGPLGKGICPDQSLDTAKINRGRCNIDGAYHDLRKIADATDNYGQPVEIFWNPFSYNVGCNYKQDDNCDGGTRRNINLKDFIYVLRSRDAFSDPNSPGKNPLNIGCPVQWDAGSVNLDACSHHFDVYMAEDFYKASLSAAVTNDPENPYYFIQQVVQNCKEQATFIPAPEANLTVPPLFLKSPFVWQNDKNIYTNDKIVAGSSQEALNYNIYVWTFPNNFYDTKTASTANLLRGSTNTVTGPLTVCPNTGVKTLANGVGITATPTPPLNKYLPNCYDPTGNIFLKDDNGQNLKFKVYSKLLTPQTFTLVKDTDPSIGYVYNITFQSYPENNRNDKSLQLRAMQMIQRNEWTWATPSCKPAIYMYPEKSTNINVKLDLDGQLTVSNPNYDSQNGWSVVAQPDGKISEPLTLSDYPYLYYEADLKGVTIPKEGFVYAVQDLPKSLKSLMETVGFNEKETSDFMNYWLPRLTEKPYYFVTLLPEDVINQKEKLTFSINPDSLIRSRFVFEGLDAPISVKPLTNIQSHQRNGFTVADWGGTIVGKSCTDITVK